MQIPISKLKALASASLAALLVVTATVPAFAVGQQGKLSTDFAQASQEFKVPQDILLALSYNESRWERHGNQASVNGGYGLMNLTTAVTQDDKEGTGRDGTTTQRIQKPSHYTLDDAVKLLNISAETIKQNNLQNIRGAAAVLAQYAKDTNSGSLPTTTSDWYGAVAAFSGSTTQSNAEAFADSVYDTLRQGVSRTTSDNQSLSITKNTELSPNKAALPKLGLGKHSNTNANGTDCPSTLNCRFVQAGYAANSDDPADYGNFDPANRPKDMDIRSIVIHDTEGSYQSAISHFQDTTSYVSANYIIRSSDGAVTEMVRPRDVAWHAGNWYTNMHSIGIEHEGFANDSGWYTEAMYQSSAKLVRYLAKKYDIPMDREHIVGHNEITKVTPGTVAASHWDPGAYWDWDHYMELVTGKKFAKTANAQLSQVFGGNHSKAITITPDFATNQPEITDCSSGTCSALPKQGANFVYLRKSPNADAPLLTNKYLHTDGADGTTKHSDWSAKATSGQTFAVAGTQGNWTGIWYNGTIGWFLNPGNSNSTASREHTVRAKAGKTSIPVYGRVVPEASAFPSGVTPVSNAPLYDMPSGQKYTVSSANLPTDYFYDATVDSSKPHDHEIFVGNEKFYEISFNHRKAYVKASDVTLE